MAAPANKTIGDLGGTWVMSKTLSDSVEPGLALQGIGFLMRKAIGLATVTLRVKQYTGPASDPVANPGDFVHIDIDQTATGGIKGTSEHRCVNGEVRDHTDWLFGTVSGWSVWADKPEAHEGAAAFGETLWQNWLEDGAEKTGPDGVCHLLSVAINEKAGWSAAQTWGFQMIGAERRYCRNVVIMKGDQKVVMRLVYDYIP